MSKIIRMAPQLRIALYAVLAAALAVAVVAGWLTQEQSTNLLSHADNVLGILVSAALVLAASNVKTAAPEVDAPALADELSVRINTGINDAKTAAQSAAEDLRRQVEQQLGHRLGG